MAALGRTLVVEHAVRRYIASVPGRCDRLVPERRCVVDMQPPADSSFVRMPGMSDRYFERPGYAYQLGKRCGTHLLHDVAAMDLERDLADA